MRIAHALSVFALVAAASLPLAAQNPNTIHVHIPYTVMAGSEKLTPGDYIIRPVSDTTPLFAMYRRSGAFATFLSAVPEEKNERAEKSSLVLRSDGKEFILDEMWLEGRSRGYHFLVPEDVNSRERERQLAGKPADPATKSGL